MEGGECEDVELAEFFDEGAFWCEEGELDGEGVAVGCGS